MRLESAASLPDVTVVSGDTELGLHDAQSVLMWKGQPSSITMDPEFHSILLESSRGTISPRASNTEELSEFAFFFKERQPGDDTFSPVDFLYTAKLCALDDHNGGTSSTVEESPPHLKAADEVLIEILGGSCDK